MSHSGESSNFLLGQENWESKVPLKVTLAQSEITTIDNPPPLYVQGSRIGYLPKIAADALMYFRHVLPPGEDTPWFEFNGLPLWWQVPLGVSFDLMTNGEEKPWALTVHFREFPAKDLLPWIGPSSMRASYLNSLKEASYISAGSSVAVMGMASNLQDNLWNSVEQSNFAQYFRISESVDLTAGKKDRQCRNIPLRVFIKKGKGTPNSLDMLHYTSRPATAIREDLSRPTLGEALDEILPEYFEAGSSDNSNIGETASVSAAGTGPSDSQQPQASADVPEDEVQQWLVVGKSGQQRLKIGGKQVDVWVSGIRPKLDTPLLWLHSQLRHPDHFLYVVLHVF